MGLFNKKVEYKNHNDYLEREVKYLSEQLSYQTKSYTDLLETLYNSGTKHFDERFFITKDFEIKSIYLFEIIKTEDYRYIYGDRHLVNTYFCLTEHELPEHIFAGSEIECEDYLMRIKTNLGVKDIV